MNKWRRGEPPFDADEPCKAPYSAKEFGISIDTAVEAIDMVINENENDNENDERQWGDRIRY